MAKTAENLVKLNPQNDESTPDSLDQVRDILVGALVNRIESAVSELEEKQSRQNETLLAEIQDQRKSIKALERKTTKLQDDFKDHLKEFKSSQNSVNREFTKLGKELSEGNESHHENLVALETELNSVYEELKTLISTQNDEVQAQINSNTEKLEGSKVERNDLSRMLANIATMIGNEKPGSKN